MSTATRVHVLPLDLCDNPCYAYQEAELLICRLCHSPICPSCKLHSRETVPTISSPHKPHQRLPFPPHFCQHMASSSFLTSASNGCWIISHCWIFCIFRIAQLHLRFFSWLLLVSLGFGFLSCKLPLRFFTQVSMGIAVSIWLSFKSSLCSQGTHLSTLLNSFIGDIIYIPYNSPV
jgi:hypothetical protein